MIPFLAVDPSLTATGWATITPTDSGDQLTTGTIPKPPKAHAKDPARMMWIAGHIRQLARKHAAAFVAIEGESYNSISSSRDHISGLHWMIRSVLWGAGIDYIVVPPATVKIWATGNGGAATDKRAMLAAAHDLTAWRGRSHDEADAILLHAAVADALGLAWTEPDHDRRHEALAPIVAALARTQILGERTQA